MLPLLAPSTMAVPGLGDPKYTPLPRPKGLTVGTLSPGEAPMGVTPMVNYETRTLPSIPAWYNDRKPTSADCEYICKQDNNCMEQSFDAARSSCALFGRVTDKPTPPSAHRHGPSPAPLPSAASSAALSTPAYAAELRGVIEGTTLRRKPSHGNYTNPKWWDEEALASVERMQTFVNGSRGHGVGSRTKERSALEKRAGKELLAKEWAQVTPP
jgi:hypothetical protein